MHLLTVERQLRWRLTANMAADRIQLRLKSSQTIETTVFARDSLIWRGRGGTVWGSGSSTSRHACLRPVARLSGPPGQPNPTDQRTVSIAMLRL